MIHYCLGHPTKNSLNSSFSVNRTLNYKRFNQILRCISTTTIIMRIVCSEVSQTPLKMKMIQFLIRDCRYIKSQPIMSSRMKRMTVMPLLGNCWAEKVVFLHWNSLINIYWIDQSLGSITLRNIRRGHCLILEVVDILNKEKVRSKWDLR